MNWLDAWEALTDESRSAAKKGVVGFIILLSLFSGCNWVSNRHQRAALEEKQEADKLALIDQQVKLIIAQKLAPEKKELEDELKYAKEKNDADKKAAKEKEIQDLKDAAAKEAADAVEAEKKELKKQQDDLKNQLAKIAAAKKEADDKAMIDAKVQELLAIELKKVKAAYVPKSTVSLTEVSEKLSNAWISLDADGRQDYRCWKGTPGLAKRYSQRMALWQQWCHWAMANARGGYMAEPDPPSSIAVPPGGGNGSALFRGGQFVLPREKKKI